MKPIVFTENALHAVICLTSSTDWLLNPIERDIWNNITVSEQDVTTTIVSTPEDGQDARLLVVDRSFSNDIALLSDRDQRQIFERCARLALHKFDSNISINPRWMPYHHGNKISIFAFGLGRGHRIVAEQSPAGSEDIFIYAFGDGDNVRDLASCTPDNGRYLKVRAAFDELASTKTTVSTHSEIEGQIDLAGIERRSITQGFNFADWYPKHLTRDQLRFVDHSVAAPLRLRGSAGTGKTLAMVVKALKEKYDADQRKQPVRILFVTHSWSAAELVDGLITRLDVIPVSSSTIDVFPLLYLASKRDYTKIDREPLGIDSEEGKKLALREIGAVVSGFLNSDWVAYRGGCTSSFTEQIEAIDESRAKKLFCWDLLVEFGCVIAAQGILTHAGDKEKYLRVRRLRWMMLLENTVEKEVVFALWVRFMQALRAKKWISSDQIISDYLNDLSTFYWEAARSKEGYDLIFVDEMHLFNAQERLIFHNLLSDPDAAPKVVMALDPQQSSRETFTAVSDERDAKIDGVLERARLPHSEKIDLTQVFRYSPQIGRLVKAVHEAAPALDLPEDWGVTLGQSEMEAGDVPTYKICSNRKEVFKDIMSRAVDLSRSRRSFGRVAVLCMDLDRFSEYAEAASVQYETQAVIIASRDDTEKLQYAGRRFVLSMPEYVAGLQFDTVILADLNEDLVPDGKYRSFHFRRFLSELYLGLSRAQRHLVIVASLDEGGLSKVLDSAVQERSLIEV